MLERALAAIDRAALAADVAALVQVPSVTGDERRDVGGQRLRVDRGERALQHAREPYG